MYKEFYTGSFLPLRLSRVLGNQPSLYYLLTKIHLFFIITSGSYTKLILKLSTTQVLFFTKPLLVVNKSANFLKVKCTQTRLSFYRRISDLSTILFYSQDLQHILRVFITQNLFKKGLKVGENALFKSLCSSKTSSVYRLLQHVIIISKRSSK